MKARNPFQWIEAASLTPCAARVILLLSALMTTTHAQGLPTPTPATDAEIERFLKDAEIIEVKKLGVGVTNPMKLTLRDGDIERYAVYKAIDSVAPGGSVTELNTSDRYTYDVAAYRLDRMIRLNMVPVTVVRSIRGKPGSVQQWVPDAFDEQERIKEILQPPNQEEYDRQVNRMHLFDILIFNSDRNQGNILFERETWQLHLIDHSRAFRLDNGRPKHLRAVQVMPDAQFEEGVKRLSEDELKETMSGLLHPSQIKALMQRRKQMLQAWEKER